jgi:hypothetical protein
MNPFTGIIFGDSTRPEFSFLHESQFGFMRKIAVDSCSEIDAIIWGECGESGKCICSGGDVILPDIIFVVQSYPDQFTHEFMLRVRRNWSFVPVIFLLGVECGGEVRTGDPLSGSLRIYSYEWNDFWHGQLRKYAAGERTLFDLPQTSGDDEIIAAAIAQERENFLRKKLKGSSIDSELGVSGGICLVVSCDGVLGNDRSMNQLLADYARSFGYRCEYNYRRVCGSPELVLIDVDDSCFCDILEAVRVLRGKFVDSEFRVYVNSPRSEEILELRKIGVAEVVPKPFFWW